MEKDILTRFLNQHVRLVKDDNFVISGKILSCHDDGIMFYTDNKTIFLSYSRIKEISPLGGSYE